MDSALSVFFPFWQIISQGAAWLVPTLAVTLLLDSAVLMALLLILRPRRAARRSADAGNIWRRTFLPVFAADIAASFAAGGLFYLALTLLGQTPWLDSAYLLGTAGTPPLTDLFTLIPACLSVLAGGGLIYLADRYIIFRNEARAVSLALAVCGAPWALLFPSVFIK